MARNGVFSGGGNRRGRLNAPRAVTRQALLDYIQQKCEEGEHANPYEVLVDEMYKTPDPRLRVQCAEAILDRLLPKLRAVEHSGTIGRAEQIDALSDAQLLDLIAQRGQEIGLVAALRAEA